MPAFLIVSGYYFLPRLQKKAILNPLLRRLVLPYVIFVTLYIMGLIAAQKAGFHTSNVPPANMSEFLEAVFLHGAGALWFIHALIVMQLAFSLSRHASEKIPNAVGALWFLAICLLGASVYLGFLKDWVAVYFLIGLTLARMGESLKFNALLCIPMTMAFAILAQGNPIEFSFLQIGWVLSVVGTVMYLARVAPSILVHLFSWIGQNTLIILVSHALFTVSLKPFSGVMTSVEPTGALFSGVVLIVALSGGLMIAKLLDFTGLSPYLFGVQRLYVPFVRGSSMRPSSN